MAGNFFLEVHSLLLSADSGPLLTLQLHVSYYIQTANGFIHANNILHLDYSRFVTNTGTASKGLLISENFMQQLVKMCTEEEEG